MTDRPTYAPDRRPGDPLDMTDELVAFHIALDDIAIISALIESGAAALKYAPGHGMATVVSTRRDVRLGVTVARSLRTERDRVRAVNAANRAGPTKQRRKPTR